MADQYDDGPAFTTAEQHGPETPSRPFYGQGDTDTRIIVRPMMVDATSYAPLALNTAHPTISGPILVDENNFTPNNSNILEFDRIYADVPATRIDPVGYYSALQPGIEGGQSNGGFLSTWQAPSTSKSYLNSPSRLTATISSDRIGNYEVGNSVDVLNNGAWDVTAGSSLNTNRLRGEITGISGNVITVGELSLWTGSSFTLVSNIGSDSGSVYTVGRELRSLDSRTINAPAFFEVTYVNTSAPEDEVLSEKLSFFNSDGNFTSNLRNSSTPTITEYLNARQDGELSQVENETIDRWYGNIFEKRKIMAKLPQLNV